jgi:hypothetical protein
MMSLIISVGCLFLLVGNSGQLNAIYNAAVVAEEQKMSDKTVRTQLTATKLSLNATRPPPIRRDNAVGQNRPPGPKSVSVNAPIPKKRFDLHSLRHFVLFLFFTFLL